MIKIPLTSSTTAGSSTTGQQQQPLHHHQYHNNINTTSWNNCLTQSRVFRKLTKWAFIQCDHDGTGQIGKGELYEGILLVHLQLAKYAGAAACYPPTRQIVDSLFMASDHDNSGAIDEHEFDKIIVISCGQIASRIFVYYAIIILLVPFLAGHVIRFVLRLDEWMGWKDAVWLERILTYGQLAEETLSLVVFFLLVPFFFDWIDHYSKTVAETSKKDPVLSNSSNTAPDTTCSTGTTSIVSSCSTNVPKGQTKKAS